MKLVFPNEKVPVSYYKHMIISESLSIEEVESKEAKNKEDGEDLDSIIEELESKEAENKEDGEDLGFVGEVELEDVSSVPFGFINQEWENIKKNMQDGDYLIEFCSSDESWTDMMGMKGYFVVRGDYIIDSIVTEMN